MKILVQSHMRDNKQLHAEYRKIEEAGFTAVSYGYIIQDDGSVKIVGLENIDLNELVFNRASVQILKMYFVEKRKFIGHIPHGFFTSLDYNPDTFNLKNMPNYFSMINKRPDHHEFMTLNEALTYENTHDAFYKPNNDLKLIPGIVVKKGSLLIEHLEQYKFNENSLNSTILRSINIVNMLEEVRCFVVDGKAITASRYMKNGEFNTTRLNSYEESIYLDKANFYINNYYRPSNNFTIDLVLTDTDDIFIIEYNCLNTSGMYEINSHTLFTQLRNQNETIFRSASENFR